MTLPALVLAALLQSGAGLMPDPDRPSPFPASDSEADIAAKIAELRAFSGSSERDTRHAWPVSGWTTQRAGTSWYD